MTRRSFNRVVVDGDTSTNDVALCTATGPDGKVRPAGFAAVLEECCRSLATQIARAGEGASRLIEMIAKGAKSEGDAEKVARTVIGSPLVKTAVYCEDSNRGRVIAAAGRAGVQFDPGAVSLWISDGTEQHPLVRVGEIHADLAKAKAAMPAKKVV